MSDIKFLFKSYSFNDLKRAIIKNFEKQLDLITKNQEPECLSDQQTQKLKYSNQKLTTNPLHVEVLNYSGKAIARTDKQINK
ncbi:hypothetical protein BpHYR1_044755 [Brachionus plicatilis]|uniref:Uncharacterized protein n=1 Tax=Brachionus plicatilis TaxID=10195 RepID=A0A3M7Q5C2_BRAPC|nr:hypothetical protein BpHYR1_044755 [Brachionus plicatilis]